MDDSQDNLLDAKLKFVPVPAHERARIAAVLDERGAVLACPRCAKNQWGGMSYGSAPIEQAVNTRGVVGPFFPTARLVCKNCGFVSEHVLDVLGVLADDTGETLSRTAAP